MSFIVEVPIVPHLDSVEVLGPFGLVLLTPRGLVGGDHFIEVDLIFLEGFGALILEHLLGELV
jgi:hypothetical protein